MLQKINKEFISAWNQNQLNTLNKVSPADKIFSITIIRANPMVSHPQTAVHLMLWWVLLELLGRYQSYWRGLANHEWSRNAATVLLSYRDLLPAIMLYWVLRSGSMELLWGAQRTPLCLVYMSKCRLQVNPTCRVLTIWLVAHKTQGWFELVCTQGTSKRFQWVLGI